MRILLILLTILLAPSALAQQAIGEGSRLPSLPGSPAPGAKGTVLVVFRSADW